MIMVMGEHVNKEAYLSLNKLGIIKSRTETMPEVGFKRNVPYTNSPLITVKRNVYAVKLNDEVVYRPCTEGTKR